jgi:hypothetical protein
MFDAKKKPAIALSEREHLFSLSCLGVLGVLAVQKKESN